jgi:hypothetical protein
MTIASHTSVPVATDSPLEVPTKPWRAYVTKAADVAEGVLFYGILVFGIATPFVGAFVAWLRG